MMLACPSGDECVEGGATDSGGGNAGALYTCKPNGDLQYGILENGKSIPKAMPALQFCACTPESAREKCREFCESKHVSASDLRLVCEPWLVNQAAGSCDVQSDPTESGTTMGE